MPSPTDFNVSPYYDDFDESKKFHRILFRPAFAVQARELTQSQTQIQNQIERLSDHLFDCLLYTSPSPRDGLLSRMPSSA